MLDVRHLKAEDLQGLDAAAAAASQRCCSIACGDRRRARPQISERDEQIKFKDAKLQKLTFELARLKRLKFGAKTEAMTADQRRLFEETLAEDEAALQARIDALRNAKTPPPPAGEERSKRQPRRSRFPSTCVASSIATSPRSTTCPAPDCGRPMVRIGEDVSERLDIVPAEFFVASPHPRQVGLQVLPDAEPGAGRPAADRQGMPAPRPRRARAGQPLRRPHSVLPARDDQRALGRAHAAHDAGVLGRRRRRRTRAARRSAQGVRPGLGVLHADETPVPMLDPAPARRRRPTSGATHAASSTGLRGVVYDFCVGRGAKYPVAFLDGWNGTLVCDDYKGYEPVFKLGSALRRAAWFMRAASSRN
jgi:transposase